MSDSNEQKPEIKPPAEIKRETLDTETIQEYTVFSYCVLAKDVKMPTGLMVGMLKKDPDFIVISNCPRDPTDDPDIDTDNKYTIRDNGGFYIFVRDRDRDDIEIIGCGPMPGDKRTNIMEESREESKRKEKQCNKDVSYFCVDVKFKSQSGETQVHRLLAVYHPYDKVPKELCKKVVCAKLKPVLQGEGKQPITHICGALNWFKDPTIQKSKFEKTTSVTPKRKLRGPNKEPLKGESIFSAFNFDFKFTPTSDPTANVSQIFVSENVFSRSSWGTLFTNTPDTIEMRVKPRHPNYFLPEHLKIKDEVILGQGGAAQLTPSGTPKGQKSKEIAAVVEFIIKPFVQKSGTSAQTSEKPSTSVDVKEEVDAGVEEITTDMAQKL